MSVRCSLEGILLEGGRIGIKCNQSISHPGEGLCFWYGQFRRQLNLTVPKESTVCMDTE